MVQLAPMTLPGSTALLTAARFMLRPLVRLLIRNGITFPVISELLRGLYVEVAATDMLPDPRTRTDSRVSLMTGVHRKEIRRLRSDQQNNAAVPDVVTIGTQIVARWLALGQDDATGAPLPLPRSAPMGETFETLVASVTTDVRPRAVLDEWLSQGLATLDAQDRVHLNSAAFIPRAGGDEQLFFFGRNLHDHVAAAAANIAARDAAPFMDRSVHYDRLSPAMTRRLEDEARAISVRALVDLNRIAMELLEAEPADTAETGRINFGVFVYREDGDTTAP